MDLDLFDTPAYNHYQTSFETKKFAIVSKENDSENKENFEKENLSNLSNTKQNKPKTNYFKEMDIFDHFDQFTFNQQQNEDDKKTLNLIMPNGKAFVISIYNETNKNDIILALQSSCESLQEGGFLITDMNDQLIQEENYPNLKNNGYYRVKQSNNSQIQNNDEFFRKIKVKVDANKHIEYVKCKQVLKTGMSLLKVTQSGIKHFRYFQLSGDETKLIWYTCTKTQEDCEILINNIIDIKQNTESIGFQNCQSEYPFSFSIIFKSNNNFLFKQSKCVNIQCRDEKDFNIWMCALVGLVSQTQGFKISKEDLFINSRIFSQNIKNNQVTNCSQFLFDENYKFSEITLDNKLINQDEEQLNDQEIILKMTSIAKKISDTYNQAQNMGFGNSDFDEIMEYQEMIFDQEQNYPLIAISNIFESAKEILLQSQNILENSEDQDYKVQLYKNIKILEIYLENIQAVTFRFKNPKTKINKTYRNINNLFNSLVEKFTK